MAKSSLTLWIDVDTNRVLDGWNSNNEAPVPSFVAGDTCDIEIHLVKANASSQWDELPLTGKSFKLAIGLIDTLPNGGMWTLAYGNSQVDFAYNEKADVVEDALNLIPEIIADGGVTVTLVNADTTYRVMFNEKTVISSTFSTDASNLLPSSIVQKSEVKVGSSTTKAVWHFKPKQVPVVYQPNWTASSNSSVISLTGIGGNKRLTIAPDAPRGGTFILTATLYETKKYAPNIGQQTSKTVTTFPISVNATEADFDNAFPMPEGSIEYNVNGISVKKVGTYTWDISTRSVQNQHDGAWYDSQYYITSVTNSSIIQFEYVSATISLNNYETASLLAGIGSAEAVLEVEVTENGAVTTVLQTKCKIISDIIGQHTYSPTPFDDPLTQSDLNAALANYYPVTNPDAYISDAPVDNTVWGRQNGQWQAIVPDGNNIPDYDNFVTYAVGSQVYFQGKFYRMVNTAGAAGYDPVGHPSYWESLSGTSPNLSGYAQLSGATFTGTIYTPEIRNLLNTDLIIDSYNDTGAGVHYEHKFTHLDGKFVLATNGGGLTFPDGTTQTTSAVTPDLTNYFTKNGGQLNEDASIGLFNGSGKVGYFSSESISLSQYPQGTGQSYPNYQSWLSPTKLELVSNLTPSSLMTVDANGLIFPDSTVQTTAATTPDLSGYAELSGATFTGKVVTTASVSTAPLKIGVSTTAPTTTVAGDVWVGTNNIFFKDSTNTQRALVNQNTQNTFSTNQIISASSTLSLLRITQSGTGQAIVVEDATNPDTSAFIVNADGIVGIQKDPATWTPTAGVALDVTGKIATASATASAGLNLGATSVAPTTPVQGDIWMASNTDTLRYRGILTNTTFDLATRNASNTFLQPQIISNPSNATIPAFRITNIATATTAHSLLVEDETNPDTTAFIIDNAGNIGIGVPTGWTPTQKFELNGSIKFTADSSVQTTAYIPSNVAITGGSINGITIDGGTY